MLCVNALQAAAAPEAAQQADGDGAEAVTDAMEVEDDAGPAVGWDDDIDDDDDLVSLQQQGWVSALMHYESPRWCSLGQNIVHR